MNKPFVVTADMVGMYVEVTCSGCHGSGWHNAWANHRPVGVVPCYLCGGREPVYAVNEYGRAIPDPDDPTRFLNKTPAIPGDGRVVYPIGEWQVGRLLEGRHYNLRTFA